MKKVGKRALFVEGNKLADAKLVLGKAKINVWSDVNVLSFNLFTAVVTSAVWIAIIIAIALLN